MKTTILALALLATGCTTSVKGKPCYGLADKPQDGLTYELSIWNTFLGVLFNETVVVPIVVIAKDLYCPVESN